MAAFRGMHVLPTKHSYMRDYEESVMTGQTHTHRQTPDKVIPICAGDTKREPELSARQHSSPAATICK